MSDAYERVKGGRLSFKDGTLATRKSIDKKKKKKNKHKKDTTEDDESLTAATIVEGGGDGSNDNSGGGGGVLYSIDAAKGMKYDQLFPVEAKKFNYDPKTSYKTVEDALEDRVKKKADRYCK